MKTKKFNFNWQSVLLGMVLCMVLVVFVGGKANTPQTTEQDRLVKAVNESNLLTKSTEMQTQIIAMNQNLARIEQKIDGLVSNMNHVLNIVRVMDREWESSKKK